MKGDEKANGTQKPSDRWEVLQISLASIGVFLLLLLVISAVVIYPTTAEIRDLREKVDRLQEDIDYYSDMVWKDNYRIDDLEETVEDLSLTVERLESKIQPPSE